MNEPVLSAIKARLTWSSNDTNGHESTVTSYDEMITQLLELYASDDVVSSCENEVNDFKQGSPTLLNFLRINATRL